jgi:hypothetical protein
MAAVTPAGLPIAALALAGMMAYNTFNASHSSSSSKAPAVPIPPPAQQAAAAAASSSSSTAPPLSPFLAGLSSHPLLQNLPNLPKLPNLPPEMAALTASLKQGLNQTVSSLSQPFGAPLDPLGTPLFQSLQPILFALFEVAWDTRLMMCWQLCRRGEAPVLEGEELRRWVLLEDHAGVQVMEVLRGRVEGVRTLLAGVQLGAPAEAPEGTNEGAVDIPGVPKVLVEAPVVPVVEAEAGVGVQGAATVAVPVPVPVPVAIPVAVDGAQVN